MGIWEHLLSTAIHTPSPHNVQPWRLKIHSETEATVYLVTARMLPNTDKTGSFILSSMSMFVEALTIAAGNAGYQIKHTLLAGDEHAALQPFAHLSVQGTTNKPTGYPNELFLTRRTSRLPLLPRSIPNDTMEALTTFCASWGQRYIHTTDPAQITQIMAQNVTTLFEDLNNGIYRSELVPWFRYSVRASAATRDGLDYRCMHMSRPEFWMAGHFPQVLTLPLIGRAFAKLYRHQLGAVPTIGAIAGPFWQPQEAITTGRFWLRFWLELAKHQLYIHPLGNLVTNTRAAHWIADSLHEEGIWLIFKIGYSPEPPKSHRKPIAEVLLG